MTSNQYRFKFYLNARHTMNTEYLNNGVHPNMGVSLSSKVTNEFIQFSEIEAEIEKWLENMKVIINELEQLRILFLLLKISEKLFIVEWNSA